MGTYLAREIKNKPPPPTRQSSEHAPVKYVWYGNCYLLFKIHL